MNLIGGAVIFAVVLLAVANILGRKLFDLPVDGYIDWTEQSMAFFAFMGIAYCQRQGGHIRMDIFVGKLRGRMLWSFELISTFIMFVMTLLLTYGSYVHFLRAWTNGDSSFDIELPTWPAKLIVPVALSLLSLRLALQLWAYTRAIIENNDNPVGVPLIEDVATQAAKEAATVSGASVDTEAGLTGENK
ncbi:TRAP-type C4-dicarboxylate transport system, small permease component [gamma proteobacterium IMCC1989]|nr:TRAP-type C4-dicarboxylate transport system, small permease component [gamma proteobacterium IMCC1989]